MKEKRHSSIRQPIVVYALIFMGAACFVTFTLASITTVSASRRAYRRAIHDRLEAAARLPLVELKATLTTSSLEETSVTILRPGQAQEGLTYVQARGFLGKDDGPWVVVPVTREPGGLLVARIDSSIPTAIAFAGTARLVPIVLLTVIGLAGLLTLMTTRLLLSPLDAAIAAAEQVDDDDDPVSSLGRSEAPNEVAEVAQRFRQTVRRLRTERETIAEQKDQLERMQESLIRASKLAGVGRLAAGIAHEVGNPLAAVRGYLALLSEGLPAAEQAEVLARSRREMDRIHETIRGLLTYARSGEASGARTREVDPRRVVAEAIALAGGHPGIREVKMQASDPGDLRVWAHPERLQQVLLNLLLNGAQAQAGGPDARMWVAYQDAGRRVGIHIDDAGPGVPDELARSIFDPFFTTKPVGEGTGLGLAVSRALVEGMSGELELGRSPAGGARFTVWLDKVESAGGSA